MEIIQQKILGKRPDQTLCEDGLFIGEHFIAVVDGVTGKRANLGAGELPGGVLARRAIVEFFKTLEPNADCETAMARITEQLAEVGRTNADTPCAVLIVYSVARREIWSVGDCGCLINGETYTKEKAIDTVLATCRSAVIEMLLAGGKSEAELLERDTARDAIVPLLVMQKKLENQGGRYGYGVLNGTPVPAQHIQVYSVKPGDEIVLASDGYPVLLPTLEASEAALEEIRAEDPLCYKRFVSTKGFRADGGSFDDRTYVRFIV